MDAYMRWFTRLVCVSKRTGAYPSVLAFLKREELTTVQCSCCNFQTSLKGLGLLGIHAFCPGSKDWCCPFWKKSSMQVRKQWIVEPKPICLWQVLEPLDHAQPLSTIIVIYYQPLFTLNMWGVPKMWVPPVITHFSGSFPCKPFISGDPPFIEPPMC